MSNQTIISLSLSIAFSLAWCCPAYAYSNSVIWLGLPTTLDASKWFSYPPTVYPKPQPPIARANGTYTAEHIKYIIGLNNLGVSAIISSQFEKAIDNFETILRVDPGYNLAKPNLVVAHNYYGNFLVRNGQPREALSQFDQALWLEPRIVGHTPGITRCFKQLGINPNDSRARDAIAQRAMYSNDWTTLYVETFIARWLRAHPHQDWKSALENGFDEEQIESDVDVTCAELLLRKHWNRSKLHGFNSVQVRFSINQNGSIANLNLSKSFSPQADACALDAVRLSAPFAWPSDRSVKRINVEFDFVSDKDKFSITGRRIADN